MKKAIVIGGSSGIGKALVHELLRKGYYVGLSGVQRDDLSSLIQEFPDRVKVQYIDCSKESCSREVHEFVKSIGGLDLLVFTAGIGHLNKNIGFTVENEANKVNVLGFTEIVDWSFRFFDEQGHGHLVAISSMAGMLGFRTSPAYTAAKGYQINYLEALRQKARKSPNPVYVTDIRAGFVDTDISKELKRFWVASPEKAAHQICRAIRKRRSLVYVSKRWRIMAVILRLIPGWMRGRL